MFFAHQTYKKVQTLLNYENYKMLIPVNNKFPIVWHKHLYFSLSN
jgi:hypothetical protein